MKYEEIDNVIDKYNKIFSYKFLKTIRKVWKDLGKEHPDILNKAMLDDLTEIGSHMPTAPKEIECMTIEPMRKHRYFP